MNRAKQTSRKKVPLSRIVNIPPKSYPSTNIVSDDITTLENYMSSASTLEIIAQFSAGLRGAKSGRMLSVTGPYGSGKSTMAAFLVGLLAPKKSKEWKVAFDILKRESDYYQGTLIRSRKAAGVHEKGMIRCIVTARREPVAVTLLKALDSGLTEYFGKYTEKNFASAKLMRQCMRDLKKGAIPDTEIVIDMVEDVTRVSPLVFVIDEFGKNIEYFAASESQEGDLFLLQELAERSRKGRGVPLSIVTLQHMAFEDYALGASTSQRQEWAKIQGRFEDIPFANSPEQTRLLISQMIKRGGTTAHARDLKIWAKDQVTEVEGLGISADANLIASCYPLNPLALEVLPELCARYGQRERTLLSFISDAKKHTMATFIDEEHWKAKNPPTMRLDSLYDYFISGISMIQSSSANVSRLVEIETIIRDAHGLGDEEKKVLKSIGMLNLIGRSGYLRASSKIIDYAVGGGSKHVLAKLVDKSIITYRKHADEYRIWHGTDIDIAAKLDAYRSRYKRSPLRTLLSETTELVSIVAARHSLKTGTMRIFERRLSLKPDENIDENYDGAVLYMTDNSEVPQLEKPVITVRPGDTTDLKLAAVEVCAIRDILESDDAVTADWVAKRELEERLANARVSLGRKFAESYGEKAKWRHGKSILDGNPSSLISSICDKTYDNTPEIRNEMINKALLSQQGSLAKRKLLEAMITNIDKPKLGIEGYGPDRAVYEAILYQHGIHVSVNMSEWKMTDPKDGSAVPMWNAMLDAIKKARGRVVLSDVYRIAKLPPYGVRDGPLQVFVTAMMMAHKENIAMYEHGTFVPKLKPEIAERMMKNPEYFELKYFKATRSKAALLKRVSRDLGIKSSGVLDVVGEMTRTVSAIPPHIKNTKRLDKDTTVVRDGILEAREPDTLLFETLPAALGFGSKLHDSDIPKFSAKLTRSIMVLRGGLAKIFDDIKEMLFDATGIDDRAKLSKAAKVMVKDVADSRMKVFLGAVSADTLEKTEDWANYVAMSLTDVPPINWKDDERNLFENNLRIVSARFKMLARIHFAKISKNFTNPSCQITITNDDGKETYYIVSMNPKDRRKIMRIIEKITKDMKKEGLDAKDIGHIITMLSSKIDS